MKGNGKKRRPNTKGRQSNRERDYRRDNREDIRDRRRDDDRREDRLSPLNDFSWYNQNPMLTQAAARIPFPYRPGSNIKFSNATGAVATPIQGVMSIPWVPTIGQSAVATDPASVAAKEIYGKVREAFSGSIDADAPDFVIYFMALDSIFSYIAHLKRIYRILNTYTPENYNIPDVLLKALGVYSETIQNLRANKAQLWQCINELVGMTYKFRCPAVFDIFNRHYWMNDNVYTDAASANSQMYVFTQDSYYKFALQNTPAGVPAGGLTMVGKPSGKTATVETLFNFGRTLIDALAGSDDAYLISGYLMRAYEGAPAFIVDQISNDERFAPVYVPEVLAQIENAFSANSYGIWDNSTNVVSQDPTTNALICNPKMDLYSDAYVVDPYISVRSDLPTVEEVVEATRLKNSIRADGSIICASEIVLNMGMHDISTKDGQTWLWASSSYYDNATKVVPLAFRSIYLVQQYDWHPISAINIKDGESTMTFIGGDVHNITIVTQDQLANLHKVCLYSEFKSFNQL